MTTKKSSLLKLSRKILNNSAIVRTRQTHSSNVAIIEESISNGILSIQYTDALITRLKNTYLCIKAADCMPILIHHKSGIIAAIHSGREGTIKQILHKTIKTLLTMTNDLVGYTFWFGPCICKSCHQINAKKDLYYDLISENKAQIASLLSIKDNQLLVSDQCTCCNANEYFYSYRADNFTKKRNYIMISQE